MAEIKKLTRKSLLLVEYQIEYKVKSAGQLSEYRVRRGSRGTWTKWLRTQNINLLLSNLGFGDDAVTLLNDFYFESYFGRGEITLNAQMVEIIATGAGQDEMLTHFYSRLKPVSGTSWILPASALETKRMFDAMKSIVEANI